MIIIGVKCFVSVTPLAYSLEIVMRTHMPKKVDSFLENMLNIRMLFDTGWLELMPQADRDILLAWREYRIKLKEYREKTKALRDSLKANEPRLIETSPNSSSSSTKSK